MDVDPFWIQLWPAAEVWELNRANEVQQNLPGFVGFASNGGGELLAFDVRSGPPYPIVTVTFIVMALEDVIVVSPGFAEFASHFGLR